VPESPFDDSTQSGGQDDLETAEYPTNHVVGVLDTSEQTACALDALVSGGFLESEVQLMKPDEIDRLAAGTGRRGIQHWFIRLTGSLGLKNAETEMKERYEHALREGGTLVAVLAPTEDRKDLAAQLLQQCGGHFINFFGRLNVERIAG
jgi:hypothetical protein